MGRDGEVRLSDPAVSRHHATLRARLHAVSVADAGGPNPTRWRRRLFLRPVGTRFRPVRFGSLLTFGDGTYRIVRPVRRASRLGIGVSPWRLALPLAMTAAMMPFAINGPPWRWILVLLPLLGAAAFLGGAGGRALAVRRGEDPLEIWIAAHEGRAFAADPVLPRRPRALRRGDLAGTGWAAPSLEHAAWLAGFLAVHNDPAVVAVDSPWLSTGGHEAPLTVRFAERPPRGPAPREALVTWGPHPPAWAVPLALRQRATPAWAASLSPAAARAGGVPSVVPLDGAADLSAASVRRAWARDHPTLEVPLGRDADGIVTLDLAADGPHLMVAGTTGAGKSELLTSLVLSLAASNSPERLHLILVDFKGGAAFGPLTALPHCVGLLTDLDRAGAERALGSLRAQLTRREEVLAAAGCRDIGSLDAADPGRLPRLLVVVDEFRAFADDHPDLLENFQRLAAQGRSLGVHLVVATQRPAGAVPSDLRANLSARLCLRVAEAADSSEVIGDPAAARLPSIPGRAILATDRHRTLQVAWAGTQEHVEDVVDRLSGLWSGPRPEAPWLPPLPAVVPAHAVPPPAVGLADLPARLRQDPVMVTGNVLVTGPIGSGRTGVARALAAAALADGHECWVVTASPWDWPEHTARWGGFLAPRQTRLIGALIAHVTAGGAPRMIVLDDAEEWIAAEDSVHGPGAGTTALAGLLRLARPGVLRLGICGGPDHATARWATQLTTRLVLAGTDAGTAALAGVPRALAPGLAAPLPGRAALLPDGVIVHVTRGARPERGQPARRFQPLPQSRPLVRRTDGGVAVGADAEGEVWVDHAEDLVVVGRPGAERADAVAITDGPGQGVRLEASPGQWAAAYSGELGRLKETATILVVRPDLTGPPHGLDLAAALEPGSEGYAVLVRQGVPRAIRLARLD